MARIRPLRGIRYNTSMFNEEDFASLIAPPYDVIDAAKLDALYAGHPHNITRIDLNRLQGADYDDNNRYTRARRHMMDWLATGVFQVDDPPALYVLEQIFDDAQGNTVVRRGFISLVGLAEYSEGVILPHERTLKGPKVDRLNLMKATEANLSQIFLLYNDPERVVDEALFAAIDGREPAVRVTSQDGVQNAMWVVEDEAVHARVAALLEDDALLIADGHHRYETALAYRDFRREVAEEPVEDAPYEYVMSFLVNMHCPGLAVFPTHRVVRDVDGLDAAAVLAQLEAAEHFDVTRIERGDGGALLQQCGEAGEEHPSFVMLAPNLPGAYLIRFTGDVNSEVFDEETPAKVRALDVAILHEAIIDRMLGVDKEAQAANTNLDYHKNLDTALAALDDAHTQLVFLMNATPVAQVDEVCRSGGKMPQKSTFFYPKVPSGLVVNAL